jgi:mRNA interferase MazF
MNIKQFEIWIADLNPRIGTEPGKTRPVIIVQTDLLNGKHPSSLICPLTTQVHKQSEILRVHLKKGEASLDKDGDVLIDQIRAIDNKRLIKKIGTINKEIANKIKENIKIVLDLE